MEQFKELCMKKDLFFYSGENGGGGAGLINIIKESLHEK
jgi:hypothetical protein